MGLHTIFFHPIFGDSSVIFALWLFVVRLFNFIDILATKRGGFLQTAKKKNHKNLQHIKNVTKLPTTDLHNKPHHRKETEVEKKNNIRNTPKTNMQTANMLIQLRRKISVWSKCFSSHWGLIKLNE